MRNYQKLSMSELREYVPKYWKKLSDSVYEKSRDNDGYYYSAKSGYKSKSKLKFQIDHIKPISKGGKTELDNLQLLTRQENAKKGAKEYKLTNGLTYEKKKEKKSETNKSTNAKPIEKMNKRDVSAEIKALRKIEKTSNLTAAESKRLKALKERGRQLGQVGVNMDCIGNRFKVLETANKLLDYAMDRDYYPTLPPYAKILQNWTNRRNVKFTSGLLQYNLEKVELNCESLDLTDIKEKHKKMIDDAFRNDYSLENEL